MNFGEKIKKLRLERDWNQEYVASQLNISVPALSRYESGTYEPKSLEIISDFARLYNVTADYLLGLDLDFESDRKNLIPVLGIVKAGYDYLAQHNIVDYIEPGMKISDPENYFGLIVKGDSMSPLFNEGDYLIVYKQDEFSNNDTCIVLINGDEATVKKVVKTKEGIELHAYNPYYPIKKFTFKEVEDLPVIILGKVIKLIRDFK
jgi:repressor LexA